MNTGETIRIAIRSIGHGYIVQLEKRGPSYDGAESEPTYYLSLADVENDLPDLLLKADELVVREDGGDF